MPYLLFVSRERVRNFIPACNKRLLGLVVWFYLRVSEAPGAIPGAALLNQPQALAHRVGAYLLACFVQAHSLCCRAAHKHTSEFSRRRACCCSNAACASGADRVPLASCNPIQCSTMLTRPQKRLSHMARPLRTATAQGAPCALAVKKGRSKRKVRMTKR